MLRKNATLIFFKAYIIFKIKWAFDFTKKNTQAFFHDKWAYTVYEDQFHPLVSTFNNGNTLNNDV